ncbi:MAG: sugar ABC transporter ATP-binding protein [Faecousia sp.]
MSEYILELKDITKRFSGVTVLEKVTFQLKRGEVHALMGENGAGKSTLMKILMGIYNADEGEILLEGSPVAIRSPKQALENGIAMIHQELNPVLDLSIAENIFLGKEMRNTVGLVRKKAMEEETQKWLKEIGLEVSPSALMRSLSVAQMQMVEIAKALSWNAKIIIMDEPTASLTVREVEVLFGLIRQLRARDVAIIYISHKMDEIFQIADRVTVLRDGKFIGQNVIGELNKDILISMMVGRDIQEIYPKETVPIGEVALEVRNLSVPGRVENASFSVRRGEVLGVAGLVGAGRSEMMEAIFGVRKKSAGEILVNGEAVDITAPRKAVAKKMAFITEDRKVTGLNLIGSVRENITIVSIRDLCTARLVSRKKCVKAAEKYIGALKIRTDSPEKQVQYLSGGNQQKIAIAKWLLSEPDIIILDEPTRGIDVGAKRDIYLLIGEFAKAGKAVIMISSEMPEVMGMSDRIMVVADGKVTGFVDRADFDEETIMHMQFGTMKDTTEAEAV